MKRSAKASKEHLQLSTYIKNIHKKLRQDTKEHGWEETWKKHCNDSTVLQLYSSAMKDLACTHWQNQENKEKNDRIQWVYQYTQYYFTQGGRQYQLEREQTIAATLNLPEKQIETVWPDKLKLLDVGSCYNPFKVFDLFEVIAIDIAPSDKDVIKCDFLALNESQMENCDNLVLQQDYFHVIVFSLFLEYLPSPELRLKCCEKAYNLLQNEGILVIITPDSKHVGANAKFMKSWRLVLANIGFCRVKYEKLPFIHCMAFRKNVHKEVAQRWSGLNKDKDLFDKLYIPQDFNQE